PATAMRKILLAAGLLALAGLLFYSLTGTPPPASAPDPVYAARIEQGRRQKDVAFRTAATSPIPVGQRAAFQGLRYYSPTAAYRVVAQLTRAAVLTPAPLALTGGSSDAYARWGTAEFELGGQPQKLALLQKQGLGADTNELFLPFTDPTNGQQTYAAGRYLDLAVPVAEAGTIELDFNTAYNPFCAYNHDYSCPKVPAENRLTVPVLAGEQFVQP
ncbi:MAG: DUF1684 domain-containing protein, partial [Janthinobacterium lividum]